MPAKKPAPKTAGRNQPQPVAASPRKTDPINWEGILDSLASAGAGPFFFVKSPKTRIRLVCLDDDLTRFYAAATTVYKGKPKTKFVVFGQVLSSDGGKPLSEQWQNKVVPIVITKTTLSGIIAILAEGYDLFSAEEGYGITILKSGTGTDTDYNVNPSPHPVAINLDAIEVPEKSLEEYAEDLTNRSASRNGGSDEPSESPDW